jgi:hypothetical protein
VVEAVRRAVSELVHGTARLTAGEAFDARDFLESLNKPVAQLSSDLLGRCSCGTGSAFAASGTSPGAPGADLGAGDMLSGVTPWTGWFGSPGR